MPFVPFGFHQLELKLKEKYPFEYLPVEDVCPTEPRKKYEYIQKLRETGLSMKVAFLTYSHGNNIGSFHFVWKVLDSFDADISESQRTIEKVATCFPYMSDESCTSFEVWKSSSHEASHSSSPLPGANK